jgi:hypothetical protein
MKAYLRNPEPWMRRKERVDSDSPFIRETGSSINYQTGSEGDAVAVFQLIEQWLEHKKRIRSKRI